MIRITSENEANTITALWLLTFKTHFPSSHKPQRNGQQQQQRMGGDNSDLTQAEKRGMTEKSSKQKAGFRPLRVR